jgi:SOS-response transcriptional repressor LexA
MIGLRFKEFRKALNLTIEELATAIGKSKGALSKIENNQNIPKSDILVSFNKLYNLNINWLLSGKGEMFLSQEIDQKPKHKTELNADKLKQYIDLGKSKLEDEQAKSINNPSSVVSLPIVGEIAAGNPLEVRDSDLLGKILVSTELISDPENFFCFRVNGWSMSPEIQHNDVVIVNKIYDYDDMDNRIVAVRLDDGITLKLLKLDHENECSWLMPINDDYKPILINQYSSIVMLGVLEFLIRSYK